jgi:hypothetical protein
MKLIAAIRMAITMNRPGDEFVIVMQILAEEIEGKVKGERNKCSCAESEAVHYIFFPL